ncbi:orotate phosphoribosyltransferase [Bacteroidota bacterium]
MNIKKQIANNLIQIKAIKLEPANPFTWASGWKSPIYCDNRKTLSYPELRTLIKNEFVSLIKEKFPKVEVIAGVATGAIAQGALVAESMGLPFIYVRSKPKGHGLENMIEGDLKDGQKVVVVEDLISTGKSSLKAVEAIRFAGAEVLGLVAIFTYNFQLAEDSFTNLSCEYHTLSDYNSMIEEAVDMKYINESQVETLKNWRKSPDTWGKTDEED